MKTWEDFWNENAQKIAENREKTGGGGGGGGGLGGALLGGGGGGFDPAGQTQTSGFKSYRAGERQDYTGMMGKGLMGSGKFTAAELKQGYRKL